ncbi:MAG: hypothetical protein M1832_003661 [Thelocarpon impressellum]|nr:MAG: hypothetical protein M1832_003661 [Thelocarpon impressellum]
MPPPLGAVKLLLQLHAAEYSPMTSPETLRMAAHALGRILISVDPALVFTSGSTPPIAAAVRPLVRLLDPPDSRANTADRLPTYESLLALTNLASHDAATAGAISTAMFPALDSLLLSQNTHLQRAAVELVCNTAVSPTTAAALAPGPDTPTPAAQQARQRLHILLALADAPEAATREAAGGALAMLTGWESVVEGILDRERGVSMVLGLCGEEETEAVLHRGVVAVRNMLCVEDERLAKRAKETMREAGAVEKLKAALRRSRDEEVLATGVEALKALLAP